MSVRGIEIHNGQVVFPEGMPQELHMGTWAAPITQGEAGQVVVSAVVNAVALGGDVTAGYFGVKASVDLTGTLRGARARVTVNEDITLSGNVEGFTITTELEAGSSATPWMVGLSISMNMEADATVPLIYGIMISNNIKADPGAAGGYSFMRLQENEASTINSVFHIEKGVLCTDIEYLFRIGGAGSYAHWGDTTHSTQAGYLKVIGPGNVVRYIPLNT